MLDARREVVVLRVARIGRAWRPHVRREDHARATEDEVFEHDALVRIEDVVLDFHVVADGDGVGDVDVLPEIAVRADARLRHDVAEVPDLRALANRRARLGDRRGMNECRPWRSGDDRAVEHRMRERIHADGPAVADLVHEVDGGARLPDPESAAREDVAIDRRVEIENPLLTDRIPDRRSSANDARTRSWREPLPAGHSRQWTGATGPAPTRDRDSLPSAGCSSDAPRCAPSVRRARVAESEEVHTDVRGDAAGLVL